MPRKGTDDYKLIIKIIEKNKVINPSSKVKVQKEPKVPKEPKLKVPKSKTVINFPISTNSFLNKKYSKSSIKNGGKDQVFL